MISKEYIKIWKAIKNWQMDIRRSMMGKVHNRSVPFPVIIVSGWLIPILIENFILSRSVDSPTKQLKHEAKM
jgi:hypothetical protein